MQQNANAPSGPLLSSVPPLTDEQWKGIADITSKLTKALATPSSSKVTLDHVPPVAPLSFPLPYPSFQHQALPPQNQIRKEPTVPFPPSHQITSTKPPSPPPPKSRLDSRFSQAPKFVPASQPVLTLPTTSPTALKRPRSPSAVTNTHAIDETLTQLSKKFRQTVKEEPKSPVLPSGSGFTDYVGSISRESSYPSRSNSSEYFVLLESTLMLTSTVYGANGWNSISTPMNMRSRMKVEPYESSSRLSGTSPSLRTYPTYDVFDLTLDDGYVRRTGTYIFDKSPAVIH